MEAKSIPSRPGGVTNFGPIVLPAVALLASVNLAAQIPLERFYDDDPALRQSALQQLASASSSQKEEYLTPLVKLIQTGSDAEGQRDYRLEPAFARIGPASIPQLLSLLDDHRRRVKGFAAEAIAMIRPTDPAAVAKLREMLNDEDFGVRGSVAESILSIGISDDKAQNIIREEARGNGEPVSQEMVLQRFAKTGPVSDQTIRGWIEALSSDESFTAFSAVGFLSLSGTPAVPSLLTAVKSENSNTRAGAMQALQGMHLYRSDIDAAAFQALKNDASARVRFYARQILVSLITVEARDALLQDEIDEIARKRKLNEDARATETRSFTRDEVLAPIAPDPDHTYPLEVSDRLETKAPDGTTIFTVVFAGKNREDLLRVWSVRGGRYRLLREKAAEEGVWHLSAGAFHFGAKVYLHLMALYSGTGSQRSDEFFRVESGGLTPLKTPQGLPFQLPAGEGVWKGFDETFRDQDLSFAFFIWNQGDANCCPNAGLVKGKYTIVGNELRYARWTRSKVPDRPE
jgi:HEAT repeat protein